MSDEQSWKKQQHEHAVQQFYGTGIDGYHDYHQGYLNFGYWTKENMTYEQAAENLVQTLGEKLDLRPESRLLDVGCGMGTQDLYLYRHFRVQRIDAVDVTYKHIVRARERAKRNAIPENKVVFHHATAVQLPFKDSTFAHVLSIEAPEHFDTREKFFHEASRVLKPGGTIVLADYSLARAPKNMIERFALRATAKLWQVPRENVYGNDVYRHKMQEAGFTDITIEHVGKWTIPGYYKCHRRPEEKKKMKALRGFWKGIVGGFLIDYGVLKTFEMGLVEYIFVKAKKR